MNVHADIFPQVPVIVKTLPDPIDQMKFFELIQIIPAPTRSALRSVDLLTRRGRGMVVTGGLSFWFGHPLPYHSGKEGWRTALNFYGLPDNLILWARSHTAI